MITDQNKNNLIRLREELVSLPYFRDGVFYVELLGNHTINIGFYDELSSNVDQILNLIHITFNCKVTFDKEYIEKTEKHPISGRDMLIKYYFFKMEPL